MTTIGKGRWRRPLARARLEEQVAYKVALRSNDRNIGSVENAVTDLACLIVISSLPWIIKAKLSGKGMTQVTAQHQRELFLSVTYCTCHLSIERVCRK
ncbi:hypothetical protein TRIUR3_31819 [Triticum urartu]|uniref:Uncharacterized protein n=1 Tax=Triticum urartu TaxID=4572 RepID=M7ZI28_TRIUA|nr:hypothetical protein TRIUR3_31819 [Triticum urartu]